MSSIFFCCSHIPCKQLRSTTETLPPDVSDFYFANDKVGKCCYITDIDEIIYCFFRVSDFLFFLVIFHTLLNFSFFFFFLFVHNDKIQGLFRINVQFLQGDSDAKDTSKISYLIFAKTPFCYDIKFTSDSSSPVYKLMTQSLIDFCPHPLPKV